MAPLFGKLFDFNNDGHASEEEELFGITMFEDWEKQEEQKKKKERENRFGYGSTWDSVDDDRDD